ncbi:hypothetical protein POX_h09608 [Penicillium oxalicum]|uniref:Uncharacterized protein n=1 Tax=Penicillium oxalicum (strain 114-2 / CGMCC 5302) TaxID=933388 RepID=S8B975_PENO1|nr:hypothetical protein POX_h09608 [Penicillium oxalicum]EPS31317.1 hypothetical protein PDE_06272 [Penicillium oxalicum 114-2]KAI2785846.1 hypothetical protein POX_h09608 [Penicillium oxalicum]
MAIGSSPLPHDSRISFLPDVGTSSPLSAAEEYRIESPFQPLTKLHHHHIRLQII